jgi:purine-binding chemotaxis protein CheW
MDFLEIRRKAKERAEARARAAAPARPDAERVEPIPPAPPVEPDAPPLDPDEPSADPDERSMPAFGRLEPLEAVAQAVAAAGGELTLIPDLPPWGEALGNAVDEAAERVDASGRAAGPPSQSRNPLTAVRSAPPPALAPAAPLDPLDEFFYREDEAAPGLPDLDFAAPAAPGPVEVADPGREYLTFGLGYEEYAIEIDRVREVLKAPVITDVPRAPRHVLGVIMVRGDIIAVFDPRRRLGLPEVDRTDSPRVLVCDDGLGSVGLLVDAVSQVVRLRRSDIEPRPQGVGSVSAEYITGIGRQAGRMFIVLDLPVVLRGKTAGGAEARA